MTDNDDKIGEKKHLHARHDELMRRHPEHRESVRGAFYDDVATAERMKEPEPTQRPAPKPQHDAHVADMRADPDFRAKRRAKVAPGIEAARHVKESLAEHGDPIGYRLSSRAQEKRRRSVLKSTAAGRRPVKEVRVDDPYQKGQSEFRRKYTDVTIGDQMHARGQIRDAQKRAFDWYLDICNRMSTSGGAIDPARIRVDQSKAGDPFPTILDAAREYRRLTLVLGVADSRLMYMLAVEGLTIKEAASRMQTYFDGSETLVEATQRQISETGSQFRRALSVLAEYKGFRGRTPGGERRSHPFLAGPKPGVDESEWEDQFTFVEEIKIDNVSG